MPNWRIFCPEQTQLRDVLPNFARCKYTRGYLMKSLLVSVKFVLFMLAMVAAVLAAHQAMFGAMWMSAGLLGTSGAILFSFIIFRNVYDLEDIRREGRVLLVGLFMIPMGIFASLGFSFVADKAVPESAWGLSFYFVPLFVFVAAAYILFDSVRRVWVPVDGISQVRGFYRSNADKVAAMVAFGLVMGLTSGIMMLAFYQ
jgi:hypothetical protein